MHSVTRVKEALQHFRETTGMVANMENSKIFVAGVTEQMKQQLLQLTGFSEGCFPIRYLGLPLSSKKWSKVECYQLVDKITKRIKTTYAKKQSYAGRLQVVLAVLFSVHSF